MTEKKMGRGILYAVTGSAFWGASGTVAQALFANSQISPLWLVGVRLLLAGLLLLAWYGLASKQSLFSIWKNKRSATFLLLFAFLGMLPSQLSYFMAIHYGNAPTATVLQFLGPIFIILYLTVRSHALPRRLDLISVIVALVGTFLLVTSGNLTKLSLAPLALFWGLAAGLSQASYTLLPKELLANFDGRLVVGWAMTLGSIPFFPILFSHSLKSISLVGGGQITFIVIFGTMLAYLFYINSLQDLQPATTGMLSSFEPLTATFLAVAFLGTSFTAIQVLGGLFVLSTIFLQSIPTKAW